jgi:hypothetical protein
LAKQDRRKKRKGIIFVEKQVWVSDTTFQ